MPPPPMATKRSPMSTSKRVTFIYRNYEGLGVGYLASYVRSLGHQVQLVLYPDPWADTYIKQKDKDSPMTGRLQGRVDRQLLREIVDFDPHLVCFSTVTDDYQWCSNTAAIIKSHTRARVIFGGVHVSSVPDRVIQNPSVDFLGLGEGERALGTLLEGLDDWQLGAELAIPGIWYRRGDEVHAHGHGEAIQDLDNLPFPAKDLFYARLPGLARTYTITSSRGCPYQCTYCYNAVMLPMYRDQGKWMRQRSVDNVLEELKWAMREFHPRHFLFLDDVFATSKKWVAEFSDRYKREVDLPFALVTEAVVLKDDVVAQLKMAGLVNVQLGVQTLNEESKDRIDRPESRDQLERAFTALNKYKVHYQIDHMLGIPGESDADQRLALEFYNHYRPDIVSVFWLKYYPKLPIIELAIEKGILQPSDIEGIEEGRNEASYLFGGNAPDFKNWLGYNALFGWLNFLPRPVVAWFLKNDRARLVATSSYFLSSSLPRLLSTFFRRPDFRGRDHVRRTAQQLVYIAKLAWQDWRHGSEASAPQPVARTADAAIPHVVPAATVDHGAAATRPYLGRRSGGKVYGAIESR
jgi:anaerobic magnesium-protoporphyrin IX monomethyl ester cyclase